MQKSIRGGRAADRVLWSARILTVLVLAVWGFFIAAHLVGDADDSLRPLRAADYVSLSTMVASLLGLAVAWKYPRVGASCTLVAVGLGAAANWRVLLFPPVLIPIAAVLFLVYAFLVRSRPQVQLPLTDHSAD